jgi:hypothetical protein
MSMSKHAIRSKLTGRFIPRPAPASNVVNGRLYDYRGATVRAKRKCNNGTRMISFHNSLFGFVKDTELTPISREKVTEYLSYAR